MHQYFKKTILKAGFINLLSVFLVMVIFVESDQDEQD